ncbi:alpha-ketoacid dehydrogenase subunit beta [Pseudonocardia sp. GCM10023141]|uniref:alpha-ketoacid dehydrogenase subunit beta n=1 Tax=Pseudonocardia sp. GCM10023141 TaxID=3252653 RepID=UPI00361AC9E7
MADRSSKKINFVKGVNLALHDALAADPSVFLMGEDIADPEDGGVWKATAGLSTKFGTDRVRSTPIAEQGFVAAGIGAAQAGLRPVVEVMLMGFITMAIDPIHNTAAKWRYMTAGRSSVPITIRTLAGAGSGVGAQHCDQLESWFAASPGLKVVQPSNPVEAYGLLTSSIFDDDPVIFIEQASLTGKPVRMDVPEPGMRIPLGKANVCRAGTDVTVIGYGAQLGDALAVADELAGEGISVEVVDLRTIAPFDAETVFASVARTRRAVIVHEARTMFGPSAEIAAQIHHELFGELAAPVQRVGAPFTPVPASRALESRFMVGRTDIEAALRRALA